jgi:hypothetical protein
MNTVMADKCAARRIARAGCVEALGIQRVRHDAEDTRVPTAAERVMAWRLRSGRVGLGNAYTFKHKTKRDWRATVPQPLCQSASRQRNLPPPATVARAGSKSHIQRETSRKD